MKFRILFLGALVLTLLGGCANRPPSFEDRQKAGSEVLEGVISPLQQIDIYQGGTHKLKTPEGRFIRIQSSTLNLNRFLEKEVLLTGEFESKFENTEPIFSVRSLQLKGENESELKSYEYKRFGFRFTAPAFWEIEEETERITLKRQGTAIIQIEVLNPTGPVEEFLQTEEEVEGVRVTVGTSPGFRFQANPGPRFYVPHPSKGKLYRIEFKEAEDPKPLFDWLSTFALLNSERPQGKRCGGPAKLVCDPGYRCELYSTERDAAGVCIPLVEAPDAPECPTIAPPAECPEYEPADFSLSGCPTRYRCLPVPTEEESLEL